MRVTRISRLQTAVIVGVFIMLATAVKTGVASPVVASLVDHTLLDGVEDVYLDGDHAYLPIRDGGRITICNIADPTRPSITTSFKHTDMPDPIGVAACGNLLYVASQTNHRLLVFDTSNKENVQLLSSISVGNGILYKFSYQNGYCFVAGYGDKKLYAVDVNDPRNPRVVAGLPLPVTPGSSEGTYSVKMNGNYAYVGTVFGERENRLVTVDLQDPCNPSITSNLVDSSYDTFVGTVVGDYYYANAWAHNGLFVFDVSDPAHPKEVGRLLDSRLSGPNRCAVIDNYAYLPMIDGDGVAVVDISNHANPTFVSSFSDPLMDRTYGIAVRGDYVFAGARWGDSLVVLNRHALTAPEPATIAMLASGMLGLLAYRWKKQK